MRQTTKWVFEIQSTRDIELFDIAQQQYGDNQQSKNPNTPPPNKQVTHPTQKNCSIYHPTPGDQTEYPQPHSIHTSQTNHHPKYPFPTKNIYWIYYNNKAKININFLLLKKKIKNLFQ